MRFEWDFSKANTNELKHGVSFDVARRVFDDPYALMEQDRVKDGELRWRTIGIVNGLILLMVAHTIGVYEDEVEETVRIISARRANRGERKRYEKDYQKNFF
jgi:uncharacterized DUF497 family protein